MKHILSKSALSLLIICLCSLFSFPASATSPADSCSITFSITDTTNGAFSDDISITFLSQDAMMEFNYTVTSSDYYSDSLVSGYVLPAEYMLAISFPQRDKFSVRNSDGTTVTSFSAEAGGNHTFEWVIVDNNGSTAEDLINETTIKQYSVSTGNTEADELWNAFLLAVEPIATDEQYATILNISENTKYSYAWNELYEKSTGENKDNFANMSPFEKFLLFSTYMQPYSAITSGSYQTYCGSLINWFNYGLMSSYEMIKNHGSPEMLTAYEALMEWQYNHFLENGSIYNFMTGKTAPEANGTLINNENDELTDAEIKEIADALEGELTDEEIDEITSALENEVKPPQKESNSSFLIIASCITLCSAAGLVIYFKRKK